MQAGRELDAMLAETVMGWTDRVLKTETCYPQFDVTATPPNWGELGARYHRVPDYSTDIASALLVQDEMERLGYWMRLQSPWDPSREGQFKRWSAGFTPHGFTGWNGRPDYQCYGDTPAHAICLAALKAKGEEA